MYSLLDLLKYYNGRILKYYGDRLGFDLLPNPQTRIVRDRSLNFGQLSGLLWFALGRRRLKNCLDKF